MTVSIAIPSRNERFLNETIRDILANARGDIEVLPILDGYEPAELVCDPRVKYLRLPKAAHTQKRHGVNLAVSQASGEYVMSVDAHCMFAPGFDVQLAADHGGDNWIQVPRRDRLDAEHWCLQRQPDGRPPIDYEHIMFAPLINDHGLHGFRWDQRTRERADIEIDDILTFQGSCWFMRKDWFNSCGFMQIEGYTGWGQEAEELSFTTWQRGGRVVVNKRTWYAHLHKGTYYGRMYHLPRDENRRCYAYSYNHWVVENGDFLAELFSRFPNQPNWPPNWRQRIWP